MADDPNLSSLTDDADARLPAAAFLRYESRADGWGPGRQAAFLAHLADHGVVADAARCVGMSLGGGYALRRTARGYPFNLGWEAALIIARRIVTDRLMTAAIKGEESRWVRGEDETIFVRQNTRLSLALLDRVNPAASLPEVVAVATQFDWFLELLDAGAGGQALWDHFFADALPLSEHQARARVRAALQLCEESDTFDAPGGGLDDDPEPPIEVKSMDGRASTAPRSTAPQSTAPSEQPRLQRLDKGFGLGALDAGHVGDMRDGLAWLAVPQHGLNPAEQQRRGNILCVLNPGQRRFGPIPAPIFPSHPRAPLSLHPR